VGTRNCKGGRRWPESELGAVDKRQALPRDFWPSQKPRQGFRSYLIGKRCGHNNGTTVASGLTNNSCRRAATSSHHSHPRISFRSSRTTLQNLWNVIILRVYQTLNHRQRAEFTSLWILSPALPGTLTYLTGKKRWICRARGGSGTAGRSSGFSFSPW
jgi:hypothetical protein